MQNCYTTSQRTLLRGCHNAVSSQNQVELVYSPKHPSWSRRSGLGNAISATKAGKLAWLSLVAEISQYSGSRPTIDNTLLMPPVFVTKRAVMCLTHGCPLPPPTPDGCELHATACPFKIALFAGHLGLRDITWGCPISLGVAQYHLGLRMPDITWD